MDEVVRQVDLRLLGRGVDDRLPELGIDRALVGVLELGLDVSAQLVERVEAAGLGGEVVVELR
jgi:hypothetical protein